MRNYNPQAVAVAFGGRPITGFSPGTFIEVEYDEEGNFLEVGIDGEGCRSLNPNQAARIRMRLMGSSDDNGVLSDLYLADRASGGNGLQPFAMKDASGETLYAAEQAFIERMPTRQFSKEPTTEVEWVIRTDRLIGRVGGNA